MVGSLVRQSIKSSCNLLQINELLLRQHSKDVLVLCYHAVLSKPRVDPWSYVNCVDADSFRQQLRWLKSHVSFLDLAGLRQWQDGHRPGNKPAALLTFDDGYRNNLTIAAPILREESVPALFFLTTGYIGTPRLLWNDEVRVRVMHWPEALIAMPSGVETAAPSDIHARRALADQITQDCKKLDEDQLSAYLALLWDKTRSIQLMDDAEAREFMTWDEARRLADLGFDIGSHTEEHPILSRIGPARIASELSQSKAIIERELNRPCISIAFPNGTVRDVNDTVFNEVRRAGYEWAFTTTSLWHTSADDPHRIPRMCFPGHTSLATFKMYASGLHARLSHS